jgi:hypothetical protein
MAAASAHSLRALDRFAAYRAVTVAWTRHEPDQREEDKSDEADQQNERDADPGADVSGVAAIMGTQNSLTETVLYGLSGRAAHDRPD